MGRRMECGLRVGFLLECRIHLLKEALQCSNHLQCRMECRIHLLKEALQLRCHEATTSAEARATAARGEAIAAIIIWSRHGPLLLGRQDLSHLVEGDWSRSVHRPPAASRPSAGRLMKY